MYVYIIDKLYNDSKDYTSYNKLLHVPKKAMGIKNAICHLALNTSLSHCHNACAHCHLHRQTQLQSTSGSCRKHPSIMQKGDGTLLVKSQNRKDVAPVAKARISSSENVACAPFSTVMLPSSKSLRK